jgi:hypothetical protein
MFFGLDAAVKFPANFIDAPYTVIAGSVVVPPQRFAFPFSLIASPPDHTPNNQRPARNTAIPAWLIRRNMYALLRNEAKFTRRNRARRNRFDFDVFRPEILEHVTRAIESLERAQTALNVSESADRLLGPEEIEGIGSNYVRARDVPAAIEAYRMVLSFGELRRAIRLLRTSESTEKLSEDRRGDAEQVLRWLLEGVVSSRRRDWTRGTEIIPDYASTHGSVVDDAVIRDTIDWVHAAADDIGIERPEINLD